MYGKPITSEVDCGKLGQCQLSADIYSPMARFDSPPPPSVGWPLIVAIPGGPLPPGAREGLSGLAGALAVQGAVVVTADWRESQDFGGGFPTSFEDVACAIRFARQIAGQYHANPRRVVLVAHSYGGIAGAVLALSARGKVAPSTGCVASTGSPAPDAYVGVAPLSVLDGVDQTFLVGFFGGTRQERPVQWAAGDPLMLASAASVSRTAITLVTGSSDGTVRPDVVMPLLDALQSSRAAVAHIDVSGAGHDDVLVRPETIAAILDAAKG